MKHILATVLLFCGCGVLFPSRATGQGCKGAVTGAYSSYTSYAVTAVSSDNTTATLSVSETIDGYANLGNLEYCPQMTSAIHTPAVYVFVNGSGGWQYGPGKVATAYVDYTGTAQASVPVGPQFEVEDGAQATCSLAGTFWFVEVAAFWPQLTMTNYGLTGETINTVDNIHTCTWASTCANLLCRPKNPTTTEMPVPFAPCPKYMTSLDLYFPLLGHNACFNTDQIPNPGGPVPCIP